MTFLVSQAGKDDGIGATGAQLFWMLLLAGWLPSWALAAGVMVLVAFTAYLPLFFLNVVWFVPLALLPRGLLTELLLRPMTFWRT